MAWLASFLPRCPIERGAFGRRRKDTCRVAFMLQGFVSGGVLMSTMIVELPRERVIDEHV
jgi:hypothetical protein